MRRSDRVADDYTAAAEAACACCTRLVTTAREALRGVRLARRGEPVARTRSTRSPVTGADRPTVERSGR